MRGSSLSERCLKKSFEVDAWIVPPVRRYSRLNVSIEPIFSSPWRFASLSGSFRSVRYSCCGGFSRSFPLRSWLFTWMRSVRLLMAGAGPPLFGYDCGLLAASMRDFFKASS